MSSFNALQLIANLYKPQPSLNVYSSLKLKPLRFEFNTKSMEVMGQEPKVRLPSIKELTFGLPNDQPGLPSDQPAIPTTSIPPPADPNYSYQQPGTRQNSFSNPITSTPISPPTITHSIPHMVDQPQHPQQPQTILLPPPNTSASSSRNGSLSGPGTLPVPPPPPTVHLPMRVSPMHMPLPIEYQQHPQHPQHTQRTQLSQHPQTYTLPPNPNPNPIHHTTIAPKKKRPRRKANEMVRLYACNYKNCRNSYGTLNHLNAHITFKRHGPKRKPEEFKQIRELYKLKKKLSETTNAACKASQEMEIRQLQASINADALQQSLECGNLKENLQSQENIRALANLSETLIDKTGDDAKIPVFHQQRGYNGYGRYDHTLTTNELEKLPISN